MLIRTEPLPERRTLLRLLLAERSVADAAAVTELLAAQPEFRLQHAGDVPTAIRLLDGHGMEAALVSQELWEEEGAELARFLREQRPDVAVVLLTSGEREREALPALKLGANDFASKRHLDGEQLAARVLAAVAESRALRRRETMVRWLEREARTDHLTGLFNRRAFDERLREVCAAGRSTRAPVTLVLMDVTGTRAVNEAHGHEVGDAMIRRAATGVARCVRTSDFAARVGGDDFGLILAGSDLEGGRRLARRVAQEIERLNAEEWGDEIPVSVVFGVASGQGCEAAELLAAGEAQLGRHRGRRAPAQPRARWEENGGPSVA
ncbi:MAG: GGDEF domain-containing response regulator [Dehalococcoidia bacterium]|nr:GGDEF domain-containing response regulator [Dehalococcoidia bacterium]